MDGQACRKQARGIGDHFDFAGVARAHFDLAGARDARQPRPHHVERVIVQVGGRQGAREIEDVHRKRGGSEPFDDQIRAFRQRRPGIVDLPLYVLQRDDHVGGGFELRGDLGRAAERRGSHAADARHFHDRLLERARHRQHHGVRGQRAAMADDDDPRELQAWIDAAGEPPPCHQPGAGKERHGQQDRAPVSIDDSGQAHDPIATAAPSGSPF